MGVGRALLIGLTSVDPATHNGWTGQNGCWGCEKDVDNMAEIAFSMGFEVSTLKTVQAKKMSILASLDKLAYESRSDDIFLFYFSGHGGQQIDQNGDEFDGHDETLVAFDNDVVDDELNRIWLRFPAGARIVTISDSCNSGTVYRLLRNGGGFEAVSSMRPLHPIDKNAGDKMKAQLIHFGGCRDGGTSSGLSNGGVFTLGLKDIWNKGQFSGGYEKFHEEIKKLVKSESNQEVQMARYGVVTTDFLNQKPFTI